MEVRDYVFECLIRGCCVCVCCWWLTHICELRVCVCVVDTNHTPTNNVFCSYLGSVWQRLCWKTRLSIWQKVFLIYSVENIFACGAAATLLPCIRYCVCVHVLCFCTTLQTCLLVVCGESVCVSDKTDKTPDCLVCVCVSRATLTIHLLAIILLCVCVWRLNVSDTAAMTPRHVVCVRVRCVLLLRLAH
jgi:hypothetical protein